MGVGSKDVKIFILSVLLQKDVYHRFYGWICLSVRPPSQ